MIKQWRERRRWRRWVKANQDRLGIGQITDRPPRWDGPHAGVEWSPVPPAVQRYRQWRRRDGNR